MRALPAGWPSPFDLVQTPPTVYLRLPGSSWPPESVVDGESLPAGTTRVGEWSISCDLDAPLMPGQINTSTKMSIAEASCTIPQPEGGLLAPWRGDGEAPPKSGACELIASYDGPAGSTAFVLGKFTLDPIKGKLSDRFLSLTMVQDLLRLRKWHTIPTRNPVTGGGWGNHFNLLQHAAHTNGFAIHFVGGTFVSVDFAYWPRRTDQLDAMQDAARACLAAMFLSMDGNTIEVRGYDYLAGNGSIVETLNVLDTFEDLSWSQDPGAVADRVEVSYIAPIIDNGPIGPAPFNTGAVWTAPKGQGIPAGGTWSFEFDPGSFIRPQADGGTFQIMTNERWDGGGNAFVLTGFITQRSSGQWEVSIPNPSGAGRYLVLPWDRPPYTNDDGDLVVGLDRGWGMAKGTPSFIPGYIDRASDSDGARSVAWGVASDDATNALQFSMGRNVQFDLNAGQLLNTIVSRVQSASWVVDDVNVVPHLGRELADLDRLLLPEAAFDQKAMVTGIKTSGDNSGIKQSLSLAILS